MLYRSKIVPQIDCAGLERLKSTTEKVRGGFIRVGEKSRKKKLDDHPASHAGPASYSESHVLPQAHQTASAAAQVRFENKVDFVYGIFTTVVVPSFANSLS